MDQARLARILKLIADAQKPKNPIRYIYGLCDPDTNEIRYVGQAGEYVRQRGRKHVADVVLQNRKSIPMEKRSRKEVWITELLSQGKEPVQVILEELPSGRDVDKKEQWWIKKLVNDGLKLTNNVGNPLYPRIRKKHISI